MKPEGPFIADRVAAQHCPELLRGAPQTANSSKQLALLGERLPDLLAKHLSALCAGADAKVNSGEPLEVQAGLTNEKRGEPVLNCTIAFGPKEVTMIASLPCRAILGLVDVALGGSGKDCEIPSGKLPLSVQLMFARIEKTLISVLTETFNLPGEDFLKLKGTGVAPEVDAPFSGCKRTILPVQVSLAGQEPWELAFVFPGSSAAAFLDSCGSGTVAATSIAAGRARMTPFTAPLGAVPLPLTAILVDMMMPVSMLSQLKPGMVIPVAVARSVPLVAGEQVVAHGTVGEMDDRAALQLTRISATKEN